MFNRTNKHLLADGAITAAHSQEIGPLLGDGPNFLVDSSYE